MATASYLLQILALFTTLVCLASSHKHKYDEDHSVSMKCVTEGRFAHPDDCGSFIDCLPKKGGFEARVGSCRGRAYHPTERKCYDLKKMKGCKPRDARAIAADSKLDYVCEGATSEFVCANCKTLVNCVNGTAYPEPCGAGDLCDMRELQFGGGVCYPKAPPECACDQPKRFKVDIYDETRFFYCENEDSDPLMYQCPDDHSFDPSVSQCVNFAGLPECTSIGVFANPNNCTEFYTCIHTTNGWVQKPSSCDNDTHQGMMYNEDSHICEDPCTWSTGKFTCSTEGRFPDPLNCQRYFECVADPANESGFRQTLRECPEGYEWDTVARNKYGHCVLKGASKNECVPITTNKCKIPDGQCAV